MHFYTPEDDVDAGIPLKAGQRYLVEDRNAGELLSLYGGKADFVEFRKIEAAGDDESVVIVRPGGIGDLISLRPVIEAFRKAGARVSVACFPKFACALQGACKTVPYPVAEQEIDRYDAVVALEDLVEGNPLGRVTPMQELFAGAAGVSIDTHPVWKLGRMDRKYARKRMPKKFDNRITIQMRSSAPARTLNGNWLRKLMLDVLSTHPSTEWLFLGAPGEIDLSPSDARLVNCTQMDKPPTLAQSAALIASGDVFVGVDSSLLHVARALVEDNPRLHVLGLFGVIPSRLRIVPHGRVTLFDPESPCSPCFHHGRNGAHFPDTGADGLPAPCGKYCTAMASIAPKEVAMAVRTVLK